MKTPPLPPCATFLNSSNCSPWSRVYCKRLPGVLLAVLSIGCNSNSARPMVERVAVLRFENLSGDASLDWAGRAVARRSARGAIYRLQFQFRQAHGGARRGAAF